MHILLIFGISLILTLIIELLVTFIMGVRSKHGAKLIVLINVITNPVAVLLCWLADMYVPFGWELMAFILIELAVVFAEARILQLFANAKEYRIMHPVKLAITANLTSCLLGIVINELIRIYLIYN